MKPKLLKNNHDYEMALKYIESLMEQPESKVTNEEIKLFTSLISSYEEKVAIIKQQYIRSGFFACLCNNRIKRHILSPIY